MDSKKEMRKNNDLKKIIKLLKKKISKKRKNKICFKPIIQTNEIAGGEVDKSKKKTEKSIDVLNSTSNNLYNFYNIPKRDTTKPINIGLAEYGDYASKEDLIIFYNNYIENKLPYFSNFINNIKFIGEESSVKKAKNVWNGNGKAGPESSLDIQVMLRICQFGLHKDDSLTFFVGDSGIDSFFTYLNDNIQNEDIPKIWSISYDNFSIYDKENMQPIINNLSKNHYQFFSASGDDGSSNFRGNWFGPIQSLKPADFPYITSVGATVIDNFNKIERPSVSTLPRSNNDVTIITSGGGMDGCEISSLYPPWDNNFKDNFELKISPTYKFTDPSLQYQNKAIKDYIAQLKESNDQNINQEFINKIQNFYEKNSFYPRAYPDVSFQGTNYNTIENKSLYSYSGTSASTPLCASIFAIIYTNLDKPEKLLGNFNEYLYNAFYDDKDIFKKILSYNKSNENNGATSNSKQIATYSWILNKNRLSNNLDNTSGFDCVVGLGSFDATKLYNYLQSIL